MTRFSTLTGSLATALALSLLPANDAAAGHERHRPRDRAEVDVNIRASLEPRGFAPSITVSYRVNVEDARRGQGFDLLLRVTENGRAVRDRFGRPLVVAIPLSRGVRVGRDEIEFRGQINIPMGGVGCRPDRLGVTATVTPAGGGPVLESDSTRVEICR